MSIPSIGIQIMHNGRAIELLYKIADLPKGRGQLWRAKMLFVDQPDQDVTIAPKDVCRALHTQFAV